MLRAEVPIRRAATPPREVFASWGRAQRAAELLAREAPPAPAVLRATGFLEPEVAERIVHWYLGPPTAPAGEVEAAYGALELEIRRLVTAVQRLGVRVRYVHAAADPHADAAELCSEPRQRGSLTLRTIACDAPHPLLDSSEDGIVDRMRAVHDVFGHAALGVGFDLQSEFATWLQCRTLFSPAARPAAFCELVGAVTAFILTGEKPTLRADLPPSALLMECDLVA
jgi:hypothetical protein